MQTYSANMRRSLQFMRTYIAGFRRVEAPATSRHTSHSLRLLPSGPDRVHELLLREDQGLHRFCSLLSKGLLLQSVGGLSGIVTMNARTSLQICSSSRLSAYRIVKAPTL